jgi:hypothetical protein
MESKFVITQLEKLFNMVLTSKYEDYLERIDVYDINYNSLVPKDDKFNTVKVRITVTPYCADKLYGIWKRLRKTEDSYENFVRSDTNLSHLFVDDIFQTDLFGEINDLIQYVLPGGYLVHPIKIKFPEKLD